ncbi:MAG: hypothetical protein ACOYXT_04665 [Bacteroidota bacterium]
MRKYYEDQYASVSFVESVPCIKVKISGIPTCSEHYQFVHSKLLELINRQVNKYCRLHLLTDSTQAGLVLDEDLTYYKMYVIPALEQAGIRYHAIVMPHSLFARLVINEISLSTKRLKIEYFNTVTGAFKWLRKR